jgi:hypothetical protein
MIIATRHLRTKEADLDTLLLLDIDPLTLQRARLLLHGTVDVRASTFQHPCFDPGEGQ